MPVSASPPPFFLCKLFCQDPVWAEPEVQSVSLSFPLEPRLFARLASIMAINAKGGLWFSH